MKNSNCRSTYRMSQVRASYQIRQLKHIRRYLDFPSAAAAVHSFVTSRLDYCNELLAAAPAKQTDELQRVLNASARVLLRLPRYDFDLRVKVRDQLRSKLSISSKVAEVKEWSRRGGEGGRE